MKPKPNISFSISSEEPLLAHAESRFKSMETASLFFAQKSGCIENQAISGFDNGKEIYLHEASASQITRAVRVGKKKSVKTAFDIPQPIRSDKLLDDPRSLFDQAFLRNSRKKEVEKVRQVFFGVDLFSGCGGLTLGISEACSAIGARFEVLLAVDKDPHSLAVYIHNFSPKQTFDQDIWKLISGRLGDKVQSSERKLLLETKEVHIVLAGPPCQGNSNLNNHTRRADERNHLYERVARFAEIAHPEHILIENVPTVIHGRDRALYRTIEHLQKLKYTVDSGIVNLVDLGVPQKRQRHVLVASLTKTPSVASVAAKYRVSNPRSVRWAIEDLEQENNVLFDSRACISPENQARIDYLMQNDEYDLPNHLRPICHQNDDHSYNSMYGRLRYDAPAQTITTGFSSPGQGRYVHPVRPRTLTPHEAARLQFFPDSFFFAKAAYRKALARMIGNAVPMKLSYVFGLELLS